MKNAVTYEQLLTLPWFRGIENGVEFFHYLQPGYENLNGDTNYFGTSKEEKRIISVNADYSGHTFVKIMEDCGTRTVFNGHVESFEQLQLINSLVL